MTPPPSGGSDHGRPVQAGGLEDHVQPLRRHGSLPARLQVAGDSPGRDFLTTCQRPATPEEAERLPSEHSTSPVAFQMALNSFHGLADYLDYFDTMDPDNIITAREIFGRGLVKSIVEWWEGVRRGAVKRGR